jgi:hypothetical protein
MTLMSEKKGGFALEDELPYLILHSLCFGKRWAFDGFTMGELNLALADEAAETKIRDFAKWWGNPKKLARWIASNIDALRQEFAIAIERDDHSKQNRYWIVGRIEGEPVIVTADGLAAAREAKEREKHGRY